MFYDATLYMSNSKFVTLSSSIPIYNSLLEHLEKLVDVNDKNYCNSSEVRIAILKGYEKLKTYYIDTAKKIFTDTFKNFYQDNIDDTNNRENTNDESDFLFNILGENNNNDYNEAEAYLQQPVASIKTDPLIWWKVNCMNFL